MRAFEYTTAASAAEAVLAVTPGTRFLAGGTNLYDLMKLGVEAPEAVVDVTRVPELARTDTSGPDELVFGSGARMADVAEDPVLLRDYPALAQSLALAASQQLRTMATVGGNLLQRTRCAYFRSTAHPCDKREPGTGCPVRGGLDRGFAVLGLGETCVAVYPGDWAVALLAFDAVIDVLGPSGTRTVPLGDLHRLPGSTPHLEHTLAQDELITAIRVPTTRAGRASTYLKIRDRESYAFALTSAAAALAFDGDAVTEARIAVGGVATKPWRSREAEALLVGGPLTQETARAAGEAIFAEAVPGRHNGFKIELGVRTVADALFHAARTGESR
ncbi:xanthine dehydrogenase family protein subunit M [Actinocorallia sp. A-T 12471]|uniref:FAD binding domain-containing protein n=1 Tax=Actinocorallia sp. A-T 12471 TaxID=3089813 RepID=UPI0029D3B558|nr:xanthine dehydrogenase family protein subunit M [Actinocorallia sp. A-T 12471]MDX6744849.1 xanthine dehydrogenase family protein subunit M [Actinocorallia sp. A-T 12471]